MQHYLSFYHNKGQLLGRLSDKLLLENRDRGNRNIYSFFRNELSYQNSTASSAQYLIARNSLLEFLTSKEMEYDGLIDFMKNIVREPGDQLVVSYEYRPDTFITGCEIRLVLKPKAFWLGSVMVKDQNGISFYDLRNAAALKSRLSENFLTQKAITNVSKLHPTWKTISLWEQPIV